MRNYDCRGKLLSPPVPVLVAGSTLIDCLGCTFDTELFERVDIDRGKDCRHMKLAAGQLWKLFESKLGFRIRNCAHGQCDQHFIGVKTRIAASEITGLKLLDRLDKGAGDQMLFLVDIAEDLDRIQKNGRSRTEQIRSKIGRASCRERV